MSESANTTKNRLLDAAEELFAKKGFDQVSIRELAATADVNVAAVNYHFQGKDNLFQEVILRRFVGQRDATLEALEETLARTGGRPSCEEVIEALTRRHLIGAIGQDDQVTFLSLIAGEMNATPSPAHEAFFKEMVAPVFAAFSQALMAAQPNFKQEDLNWIIASIVGQIHHFIFRWKKSQALDSNSESYQTMVEVFPALGLPVQQYIEQVTRHITRFSSAAIIALHSEVE